MSEKISTMAHEPIERVALIGFGEAGGILGHDLAARGLAVATYDILFDDRRARDAMLEKARSSKVRAAENPADAAREAQLVISAVTASSAHDVARDAARRLAAGQTFLDINSVSPSTKQKMAEHFANAPAHFVEAAVMAAVPPQRLKVPMLLGGAHAASLAARLNAIGLDATVASDRVGVASAVKMCRSVIIKGLEALATESMLAARRYGAEDAVLKSLAATFPQMGWHAKLPDYLISRVAEHGKRRAAEMREAAQALRDVGIDPLMAEAAAERQDALVREIAAQIPGLRVADDFSWRALADALDKAAHAAKK
jgi:3-hydroxyisobutyrate dehydrogenase-like beta-hydroxyacid dehydrogenase